MSIKNQIRALPGSTVPEPPAYPFSRYQVDYTKHGGNLSHLTKDEERPMEGLLARLHTFGDSHALINAFRKAGFVLADKDPGARDFYVVGKKGYLLLVVKDCLAR